MVPGEFRRRRASISRAPLKHPRPSRVTMTSADQAEFLRGNRQKAPRGRRQLLRTGMGGIVATAASTLEIGTVAADTETNDEKRKARFQPNSAEVQNFYRVNRYPKR